MMPFTRIALLGALLSALTAAPATLAAATQTAVGSNTQTPFSFDHRKYLPGFVIADTASCKKQCEKGRQKCYQRCEDLYSDSPQGDGCKSECDRVKKDVCRPRC
ncbi:MAG: hypothetical protein ACR2O4_01015 [Hyphomicrobiaceae bacterium]